MNSVFIILLNWNGWRDTLECLESLLQLEHQDFSIVVCDNGSSDDSLDRLRDWAELRQATHKEYGRLEAEAGGDLAANPMLTLIRNEGNLGFAGGNNVGIRYGLARGKAGFFWLLNNDTVVEPDALSHLVARMQQDPAIGICGSTIRLYHDHDRIQALGGGYYSRWIGLPWHYGRFTSARRKPDMARAEARMNYVEGASMLVSRPFLKEIGLMCEDYFLYFEEADWAVRAKGRFQLGYAPQSVVYHKVGASIGTSSSPGNKSYTCDYFNIRNRILFTRRFHPVALPSVYLVLLGTLLLRALFGRWDRILMILRLLFGYDGVRLDTAPGCRTKP